MRTRHIHVLSAATAGSLVLTAVIATTSTHPARASGHAALAAEMVAAPAVNLDNCPTMALGYQGGCASQLQQELTNDGDTVPVDGIFGAGTQRAVENFQQEHDIIPADGIVGPQTKVVLDNPDAATTAPTPGQLDPGGQITSGTQIASPDGEFVLQMQDDGNLVLRASGNVPLGDTHTEGNNGAIAVMQTDGNFVIRAPGNIPVWSSGTAGHTGTVLQVQDDGGVVLYGPGHQVLRVLIPGYLDLKPTVPNALTSPGNGDGGSGLGEILRDGATELFCAGIGKLAGELVGPSASASCGLVAEAASGQPIDGFELTRTLSCAALGIIPGAGDALAVACDTLSSASPAG
jgi:peptidoglycan hydrolase-like protein with peptidoglycan-binding domain